MTIIKSYGEFWNPDTVNWKGPNGTRLRGEYTPLATTAKPKPPKAVADFWNARGIYVLYSEFKPVYVGKALAPKSGIGARLETHLTDRLIARWDMFSWYSLSKPSATSGGVNTSGGRHLSPDEMVNTLEALAILITDPPLNRRRESVPGAIEVTQVGGPIRTLRSYLQELVDRP